MVATAVTFSEKMSLYLVQVKEQANVRDAFCDSNINGIPIQHQ
jgi:putative ubiquitin-RnfH superfamily antitoxin RatB of RatAB toxin-antitoxin module